MFHVNAEEFICVLKSVTSDDAAEDDIRSLNSHPGRQPSARWHRLSIWFNGLSVQDQEKVTEVWSLAAEDAVFDVLCVLDGVRSIENPPDKGTLELYYVKNGQRTLLNPENDALHDIYQALRNFD